MNLNRSVIFFYIISSVMNLFWLLINSYLKENSIETIIIVLKIALTMIVSSLMSLIYFHQNRIKSKDRKNLIGEILEIISYTIPFTLCFLEINFLIIMELNSLKKNYFVFLQTLFLTTKLFTLHGFTLNYRKKILAFFSFFTMAFIFLTDLNYNISEIFLITIQSFLIYLNLIFPQLKWFTSMKVKKNNEKELVKEIYEQFFLNDSEPAFILEKIARCKNDYKLKCINKRAKSFFSFQKNEEKIDYQTLNHKFQKTFASYTNSRSSFYDKIKEETKDFITESPKKLEISDLLMDFLFDDRIKKTIEIYLKNLDTDEPNHFKFEILKINNIKGKSYFVFLIHDLKKKDQCEILKRLNDANNRLFCSLSHELKTPINGALPSLEMVQSKLVCDELVELLDISIGSLKLLDNSLSNILDYYLFQTSQIILNKKEFFLGDLIYELMSIIRPMINVKRLELDLDVYPEIYHISIISDYVKLRQILLNLLTNAIQFTFNGKITFKIRRSSEDPKIFHFSIEDSGIGIESEKLINILKKIKEPDQEHLKINSTGSCMGLIISEKISMLLGNNEGLSIVSEIGKGSKFSFAISNEINFKILSEIKNKENSKINLNFNRRLRTTNTLLQHSSLIEEKRKKNKNDIRIENQIYDSLISRKNPTSNLNTNGTHDPFNLEDKMPNRYDFGPMIRLVNPDLIQPISEISILMENDSSLSNYGSSSLKLASYQMRHSVDKSIDFVVNKTCDCEMILCVDDDAFNLLSLEMILKSFNVKCCKVMNGLAAIEELKRKPCSIFNCHRFRLVFMDYQMPIMDGVQTTKKINEMINSNEIKKTSVIGCTAFVSRDEVLRCYEVGMKDVIFKPLNKNIIKSILLEWFADY